MVFLSCGYKIRFYHQNEKLEKKKFLYLVNWYAERYVLDIFKIYGLWKLFFVSLDEQLFTKYIDFLQLYIILEKKSC